MAVLPALHLTPLSPEYERAFQAARDAAAAAGAQVLEVGFAHPERVRPAFAAIQMAEAYHAHAATLGTYPARASDYGPDVRERLEMAAAVTLQDYLEARAESLLVRPALRGGVPGRRRRPHPGDGRPALVRGRPGPGPHRGGTIPFRDLVMPYTVPQNLTGLPAVAVPAGFDSGGVPIGIQVTAPWWREDLALQVGALLHRRLGAARRALAPPPPGGGAGR